MECPYCGAPTNRHTETSGKSAPPRPGDFMLCSHCKGFGVYEATDPFGHRLALRPPTRAEAAEIAAAYADILNILPEVKARLRATGGYVEHPHERD